MADGIQRALRHLASSGARWTGEQRVALAEAARSTLNGTEPSLDTDIAPDVLNMVAKVAADAHNIGRSDVERLVPHHLDAESYVEMVGVVARAVAIDTTARGLGAPPPPLPTGSAAEPNMAIEATAKKRSAFVPTVGAAGPTSALSLVRREADAQADLHGSLYLTYGEMGDVHIRKGLDRWQLELVAARTSLINHCHF